MNSFFVIPAKAGIQMSPSARCLLGWMPACAGMTTVNCQWP
jgi:hypothetical protein